MYQVGEGTHLCPFPITGNGQGRVTEPKDDQLSGHNLGVIPEQGEGYAYSSRENKDFGNNGTDHPGDSPPDHSIGKLKEYIPLIMGTPLPILIEPPFATTPPGAGGGRGLGPDDVGVIAG